MLKFEKLASWLCNWGSFMFRAANPRRTEKHSYKKACTNTGYKVWKRAAPFGQIPYKVRDASSIMKRWDVTRA